MPQPAFIHLTARMSPAAPLLTREDTGAWLWRHLREAFPGAIAVVLMPDHPHVIVGGVEARAAEQRLARLLGQFGRAFGLAAQAARVAAAEPIRGGLVLARQVRYVALNPCRKGLAECPLAWPWSTHREVIGACVDPWVTAARLARALGSARAGFEARHHAYVSADPHARVEGTPLPLPAPSVSVPAVALRTVAEAVAAATRTPLEAVRRRGFPRALFVALALDQGWDHPVKLAEIGRCSLRTVLRLRADVDDAALRAARLCVADPRLRGLAAPGARARAVANPRRASASLPDR